MNIIELFDTKTKPDAFHEYNESLKAENTPLIIDNGSYQCRVGWSNCSQPLLVFRNLIAKPRKDRKKEAAGDSLANPPLQVGNDIVNIEGVRLQLKTQFDRNVTTHFTNQELTLDYAFAHLNIDTEGSVRHPILLTEALANPNFCRQQMTELLFECYEVPAISYGIDALFSWQRNSKQGPEDALILSFGYHTTHVIPVLDGIMQAHRVRRISVGGYHIITYLYRLMQMKYPVHLNAITISRMESLLHQYSSIALDYQAELRNWAQVEFYAQHVKKIQLPYTSPLQPAATMNAEQKLERRKELARRLIEANARRAKEKQLEDEQQLEWMSSVRELHERGEIDQFRLLLQDNKVANLQALDKLIGTVRSRLERNKQKLLAPATEKIITVEKDKTPAIPKPPAEVPLDHWIADIKVKRVDILKRKHVRKVRRQDMVKRHTAAAQERMRIISHLARNEKGTDEFGIDDTDWDVYKVINRDNDSDSDNEHEKLMEFETILRHYDPMFEEPASPGQGAGCGGAATAENYQLHVGVESLRAPELLFQPSMIGSSEAGLAELINYVFEMFSAGEQQRMASCIYMTGGCAQFPGLKERLSKELLEMRPFQTTFNIREAQLPELDAWLGACEFANSGDFTDSLTTRADYNERGSEYFKSHRASNLYYPTPKSLNVT